MKTLHMRVLHRLARIDVHHLDPSFQVPRQKMPRGELRPVVATQRQWPSALRNDPLQFPRYPPSRKSGVHFQRQTFSCKHVKHTQYAKFPPAFRRIEANACSGCHNAPVAGSGLAGVAAEEGIPADFEDVEEHLEAVAEHADFGGWGMAPAHGDFHGAQTVVARELQQFRVEPEALDGLLLENNPATLAVEGFEAALGVDKRQPKNDANELIENDSGKFTEGRLVHGDEAAVNGARADGDVKLLQSIDELVSFLNRSGEIGVGE